MNPTTPLLLVALATVALRAAAPSAKPLDDPAARAALPEFQTIPAATPAELTPTLDPAATSPQFSHWTRSHGDNGSRRYSALRQITKDNVSRLAPAWTFRSGDGAANTQCTPIVVDGMLYAPTPGHALVALDAATGVEKWRRVIDGPRNRLQDAVARRGLVYWPGDGTHAPRLLFGAGDFIVALDPRTGAPIAEFGTGGRTPIATGATTAGVVFKHVFVATGLFGDAYGYDVRDGRELWRFHTVAQRGEFGGETWDGPQAGANGWSGLSLDDARGLVFIALGAPRPDMVGVGRLGDNLFSDCVVALDALTGERRWHFQLIRHDIWDLDVVGPPNLVTIVREGKRVDAVTIFAKSGTLAVLDRTSGKPIFPFRLRRAPVSTLPGERTAPYQPDPELPEQISRMEFDPSMITDRSPEARAFVEAQVARASYGFYQPFTEGKPNLFIGSRGGAEWSGAAVDVPTGRLYITSNRWVSKITVLANDERPRNPRTPPTEGEKIYARTCIACHGANREGVGTAPPLIGLKSRATDAAVSTLLKTGRGAMPPSPPLAPAEEKALLDFLFRRDQRPAAASATQDPTRPLYVFDGFQFLVDHEGYPGIKPPWGLLNCYDLSTGKILWRVPLGELEALTKQGVPITGSQNLGGATVTAGGLVFVAGTEDEKLRAFDADTGKELWSAKLPFAGTAAPAVYEVGGRQFVVVTATGGGRVGGKSGAGDAYAAFALPQN